MSDMGWTRYDADIEETEYLNHTYTEQRKSDGTMHRLGCWYLTAEHPEEPCACLDEQDGYPYYSESAGVWVNRIGEAL